MLYKNKSYKMVFIDVSETAESFIDSFDIEKLRKRKEQQYEREYIDISETAKSFIDTLDIESLKKLRKEKEDNTDNYEDMCDYEEEYEYICFKIFENDPTKYDGEFIVEFEYEYAGKDGKYYFIFNDT